MQLSADPRFPGHDTWQAIQQAPEPQQWRVWLDGQEIDGVLAADDVAGMVVVLMRNFRGRTFLDANNEPAIEIRRGLVRLEKIGD